MAKVRYVGRHDQVEVPAPLGGYQTVARGEVLETSDAQVQSLLEQPSMWRRVTDEVRK